MPCRYVLHHYLPTAGSTTRFFVVLPLAQASHPSEHPGADKKGRLHKTDDDFVFLVRNPTPSPTLDSPISVGRAACLLNDEHIRFYVPLLMRPWIIQACRSTASCHLGTTRTLRMLERFYWWIGMSVHTRWWLRHCIKCQARKTPRVTARWPTISMALPDVPGIAFSVDYFGPLPVTPR